MKRNRSCQLSREGTVSICMIPTNRLIGSVPYLYRQLKHYREEGKSVKKSIDRNAMGALP